MTVKKVGEQSWDTDTDLYTEEYFLETLSEKRDLTKYEIFKYHADWFLNCPYYADSDVLRVLRNLAKAVDKYDDTTTS